MRQVSIGGNDVVREERLSEFILLQAKYPGGSGRMQCRYNAKPMARCKKVVVRAFVLRRRRTVDLSMAAIEATPDVRRTRSDRRE